MEGEGEGRAPDFLSDQWPGGKKSGSRRGRLPLGLRQVRQAISDRYDVSPPVAEGAHVNRR